MVNAWYRVHIPAAAAMCCWLLDTFACTRLTFGMLFSYLSGRHRCAGFWRGLLDTQDIHRMRMFLRDELDKVLAHQALQIPQLTGVASRYGHAQGRTIISNI